MLTVVKKNTQLEVLRKDSNTETSVPEQCLAGETVTVGDYQLRLIRVKHEI